MRIQNVHLTKDNITNGGRMIATGARPAREYKDGQSTNNVNGLKVSVVLEGNKYDTLTVTVSNPVDTISAALATASGPVYVDFKGFTANIYVIDGKGIVSVKAESVYIVTDDLMDVDVG